MALVKSSYNYQRYLKQCESLGKRPLQKEEDYIQDFYLLVEKYGLQRGV
ncbi:MAG: hypothetical protein PHO62_07515 [Sulfurimonas sp.]|nr:hypothetical protein [Sulfurimonas sp.]MDD5373253.1 hypothetical protein [Sulfurimonas sp.]